MYIQVNAFNDFFTSVALNIADEIIPSDRPPDFITPLPSDPLFSLQNNPVSNFEIAEAIKNLKQKNTLDMYGLSVKFISKFALTISTPLKHVISLSFCQGIVPQQIKIAKVIPIFKSGSKHVMDNYRPISLLCIFSKIFEKIVYKRLTSFLDINNIISCSQFGFRKEHSTVHPLTLFINKIAETLNNKDSALAIFCDLKKAFDTVDHRILLIKLFNIGVRGTEL